MDNIFVGQRLMDLRKLKGRTQEEIGNIFGVSKQAVSKWENGFTMPDITLLPKIAEFYGVTIDYFFNENETVDKRTPLNKDKVVIEATNIIKNYNPKLQVLALDHCNLKIYGGMSTAIMGSSGSGKSTLLNCICGLEEVTKGSIKIFGQEISKMREPKITKFRRKHITFIFQQYNLVDTLNVVDNILLPYKLSGELIDRKKLRDLINKLGLSGKEKSLPNMLSGGQQQRVAIARALLGKNKIIFADEPTGALDLKTGGEVLSLLLIASKEFHLPLVIITHDSIVASKCDIVHFLSDGKIYKTLERPSADEISKVMMELQK